MQWNFDHKFSIAETISVNQDNIYIWGTCISYNVYFFLLPL